LKKYFKQLNPKLVVSEVFPPALSIDGIASYFDLVTNMPLSREIVEMTLALNNVQALHALIGTAWERRTRPLNAINQRAIPNETYIIGGYCESSLVYNSATEVERDSTITTAEAQIKYLRKIINYTHQHDARIVLMVQPLPREFLKSITNYAAVSRTVADIASESGVVYIDYNTEALFDTRTDFYDSNHLTASGVRQFNTLVIRDLQKFQLLPTRTKSCPE